MDTLISIGIYTILVAAVISSILWVCLGYTWWKAEKKRIKKSKEFDL